MRAPRVRLEMSDTSAFRRATLAVVLLGIFPSTFVDWAMRAADAFSSGSVERRRSSRALMRFGRRAR